MQTNDLQATRVRRTVNDLVVAEMFLVQATIESATAIGDGLGELGKALSGEDRGGTRDWDTISALLQRTADEALEPYTSRYKYFREMIAASDEQEQG